MMNTAESTNTRSRTIGIRAKIILPLAAVAVAVSIAAVALIHISHTRQRERHLADRSAAIAHSVVHVAEIVADASQLQRFVAGMTSEPGVELILVAAGEPLTVVASSRPEWLGRQTTDLPGPPQIRNCLARSLATSEERLDLWHGDGMTVEYARPLRMRLRQSNALTWAPGAVVLQLDAEAIRREQNADTRRLAAVLLTSIALTSAITYLLLQVVVLNPVRLIAAVARSTVLGERKARVRIDGADELGQLGRRFDTMLDELARRESREREASQAALQAKQEAEAALAELACHKLALDEHAIVAVTDPGGAITYVNERFCEISKFDRAELMGKNHRMVNSGYHDNDFWKEMWRTIGQGQVWRNEVCNRAKDGSLYWVDTTIVPFKDSTGKITQHVAIRADITRRKTTEAALRESREQLARAARLDRLTGLPNRGLFVDRLQHAIIRSQRRQRHKYAVMFLDFDRFKLINDSLGHNVGDALLKRIAQRLRDHVRAVDSVSCDVSGHISARLGGDEFVVLLDDLRQPEDALATADRLLAAFATPHQLGQHEVYSTASIGIVFGDPSYERAEDVIRDADTAMYEAKRQGKARYVVFDSSMHERVQRHLKLENDLRKAIGTDQIFLTYQPIVSLRSGALYGVEALLRWDHPIEGLIGPTEFVPIAEDSGLIHGLGEWVLGESCRQLAEWQSTMGSLSPRKMCVNLSRKQFALPDFPQQVRRVIAESGVDPCQIQLEVTEDAFVSDVNAAIRTMQAIKAQGIELAIDDFGMGRSSFASLHQFPVDVLKIHRSMLAEVEDSKDVASLIHGLAVMVKNLGIDMVAEGVETAGQLIALQELGCDFAQGFFFSKPLRAREMQAFARRVLSMDCNARGAVTYAHQWVDRLSVFQAISEDTPT